MPIKGNTMARTQSRLDPAIFEDAAKVANEPQESLDPAPAPPEVTVAVIDPVEAAVAKTIAQTAESERAGEPATSEPLLDPDAPRNELEAQLLAMRDAPPEKVVITQKPTPRQQRQIDREMAAGAKRVAHFAEMELQRKALPRDPSEGHTVEVLRAREYQHENQKKVSPVGQ